MNRRIAAIAECHWPRAVLCGGVVLPFCIFGTLAEDVWEHEGFGWDGAILLFIHSYASPAGNVLMIAVSRVGGALGMAVLVAALVVTLVARKRWEKLVFAVIAYGGALALDGGAKALFRSARPHLWVSPAPASGYGFPSGHAMSTMAFVATLAVLVWPTRWRWSVLLVGSLFVGAVGLSRIYLGVHYPSDVLGDVLAAWCVALAWVVGLYLLWSARLARRWRHTGAATDLVESQAPEPTT